MMNVAQLVAPKNVALAERRTPEPGDGEVRIAVHVVGLCGTDMEFHSGRRSNGYPFVLGHECAGTIEALGSGVDGWSVGDRVTVRPNFGCGNCPRCREGRDNICPNSRGLGVTIDGCLAEAIIAPARYVVPLPQGMSYEAGALIEPLAVADRAVRRAEVRSGSRVLILGAGTIGLFAVRCAALAGAEITVCDLIPERLDVARRLGATSAATSDMDIDAQGMAAFDVVIETAGVSETVPAALRRVRPGGRVVLTGIPMDPSPIETRWIVWRELEIHGSFIYDASDFARAAARIQDGSVRALDLVTHRFSLEQISDAFEWTARRGGLKTLITVRQEAN
jgi:2-desacetyl-2-hydroxyethyl bacteriochlorophyllide A dehydrogenase